MASYLLPRTQPCHQQLVLAHQGQQLEQLQQLQLQQVSHYVLASSAAAAAAVVLRCLGHSTAHARRGLSPSLRALLLLLSPASPEGSARPCPRRVAPRGGGGGDDEIGDGSAANDG